MKAITIIQPWATLIAIGEKRFETRSWATKKRGPLAIHAGKKIDKDACQESEISSALERHGYTADNLPTGAVVATCNLANVYPITHHFEYSGEAASINAEGVIEEIFEGNKRVWMVRGRSLRMGIA
ncbi:MULTISPECIES: ASCH domain-containing protein [unclassified Paenibacillus]|uniref:ASCH domain-containing protein n=1 Tax=unclassified Paenibacillus TaxID=185978 RepID=UPI0036BF9845